MRRVSAALAALLMVSSVQAQTSSYITVGRHAIGQAMRTFTAEEIYASLKNGGNLQKTASWGSKVPYAGAFIVAGGVSFLLNKAFEEIKKEAGGTGVADFDEWNNLAPNTPTPNGYWDEYSNTVNWRVDDRKCLPSWYRLPQANISAYGKGYDNYFYRSAPDGTSAVKEMVEFGNTDESARAALEALTRWKESVRFYFEGYSNATCSSKPELADWIEGRPDKNISPHPNAMQVLPQLLQKGFESYTGPFSLNEPVPTVVLTPTPTPNQWTDDVETDPNGDLDGDGFTDADEIKRGTNPADPLSKPQSPYTEAEDFDQDGIKDTEDPDDDNDGATDEEEIASGTNPKDATSKPPETNEEEKKEEEDCKVNGGTWNSETRECGEPDPEAPPSNDCGSFAITRLLKYPGSYIKDVIFPCESPKDIFKPLLEAASTKYPFAMVRNLNNVVSAPTSGEQSAVLPNKLGSFEFDWAWLAPLITVVGLLFKGATSWIAVDLILSRLMGQVVIK